MFCDRGVGVQVIFLLFCMTTQRETQANTHVDRINNTFNLDSLVIQNPDSTE